MITFLLTHFQKIYTTQFTKILEHILREFKAKKKCYSSEVLGSPTCAELNLNQTTTVGLLYLGEDKSREGLLHQFLNFANRRELESP